MNNESYASHCLKQVCSLAIQFIVFCQRIVAGADSVSFLNVFTSVWDSYSLAITKKINLYGTP